MKEIDELKAKQGEIYLLRIIVGTLIIFLLLSLLDTYREKQHGKELYNQGYEDGFYAGENQ